MKKHSIVSGLFCVLAASSVACSTNQTQDPTDTSEHVGVAEERQIGLITPASFTVWPMGPITFANGFATMNLAVWSGGPLGLLAFDIPGITGLTLGLGTLGADGAFLATPGFSALPISAPFFTGLSAGLLSPVAPLAFTGSALLPASTLAAPLLTPTILPTAGFLSPFISRSALMFTSFPTFSALSPLIFSLRFAWPSTLNFSAINVFAASTSATSAFLASTTAASTLSFSSTLFPLTFIGPIGTFPARLIW